MNKFDWKNINFVGAGASLLAFIFTFIPFYTVKANSTLMALMGSSSSAYASQMSASKSLVAFNFFGVLVLLLSIAAVVLYVLNNSDLITMIATCLSVLSFVCLFLAMIVGNGDVKEAKNIIQIYNMSGYFKVGFSAGLVLEIIVLIIAVASFWINEFVIKKFVFKSTEAPKLHPFSIGSVSKNQFNGNAQQPQFNGYAQAPQQPQFNGQPVQPQAPQQPQFNGQPVQPQQNQFNNNNMQ
ncbi:MAG: hypothetical protein Q4F06_10170 [Eubacteriales bacterium]|nr:hypothetical protein [Eubacteriales bacterium]